MVLLSTISSGKKIGLTKIKLFLLGWAAFWVASALVIVIFFGPK